MRFPLFLGSFSMLAVLVAPAHLRADHVFVRLNVTTSDGPGFMLVPIEGRVADPKARIMTVVHEKFRDVKLNLYYRRADELLTIQEVILVPTRKEQFAKQFTKVQDGTSAQKMELAKWAIQHAMVPEFYRMIDLILSSEPEHAQAQQLRALREKLAEPLPEPDLEQEQLAKLLGGGMQFKSSAHYILAYDTPEKRAVERLELLERVYETFFLWFAIQGRVFDKPPRRLMVALFNDYQDYSDFSVRLSPELVSAAGYYSPDENVAVFFAQGTHPMYKQLRETSEWLEQQRKNAERQRLPGLGDLVRLSDTVKLLQLVQLENEDVEVVSHEATHQIAGNSGMFPRRIRIPRWAQEGLAAFFEAPKEATWSGVGAVNETRIGYYRMLENDREHSNIEFIISDHIYDLAADHGATMHAYGQAWGLTHFLIEKRFAQLMDYYRNLARLPAEMVISERVLKQCFESAFGADYSAIDQEWRRHMNELESDSEKVQKEFENRLGR